MDNWPFISIIVPVYNEEAVIARCLESLCALNYPPERHEVLVIDNGSTDRTAQIIQAYPVIMLTEQRRGSYAARNTGINAARGEIMAFTDADCVVPGNWLLQIAQSLTALAADALLGASDGLNGNLWAEFVQRDYAKFVQLARARDGLRHLNTRNCAIRTAALRAIGGFDARLANCGDEELGVRLHQAGYRLRYAPDVRVSHINPTDLSAILRQRRKQGYFEYQIVKTHDDAYRAQYFPRFQRWYYRWLFDDAPPCVRALTTPFCAGLIEIAIFFSQGLLDILGAFGVKRLYGLYALTLDLAFFAGKIDAIRADI